MQTKNYESVRYALYFAIKYNFTIAEVSFDMVKGSNDCLLLLLSYLYFSKHKDKAEVKKFKDYAEDLQKNSMDNYWLFIYEVLPKSKFKDDWKAIKDKEVSFLKKDI